LANEGFAEAHMFVDSSFKISRPVTTKTLSPLGDERLESCLRDSIPHMHPDIEKWLEGTVEIFPNFTAGMCSPSRYLATGNTETKTAR
jgi:hypothetical protein